MDQGREDYDLETIRTRATRLFLDGYTAERLDRETVIVRSPDGTRNLVNTLFITCTCQTSGMALEHQPCEHLLGYAGLLCEQEAYEEALVAALEAAHDEWAVTMQSDRYERELRELGVCEF